MKKNFFSTLFLGALLAAFSLQGCSDSDNNGPEDLSSKEQTLKAAVADYIDYTVLPTYSALADATVELYDKCEEIKKAHSAGTLSQAQVLDAGEVWKRARKNWELSEAFLFGPAANHNIDPHIDSWPLDKAAMESLLAEIRAGRKWDLTNNGGYGLIGFHSLEYVLYELSDDGNSSHPHTTAYTPEELEYMVAVARDLRDQCVCLEACWAGTENVSDAKQVILEEAELDYNEDYGWEMKNAGSAGSHFRTYQDAAQEIIQGCIDIIDEVGNTKIGRPNGASSDDDINYIESPYSLNSIEDFADNIISVERSYFGNHAGGVSLSDYIRSINPDLDKEVRAGIDKALAAIRAIPEPFRKTAAGAQASNAVTVVGSDLVAIFEKVNIALTRM